MPDDYSPAETAWGLRATLDHERRGYAHFRDGDLVGIDGRLFEVIRFVEHTSGAATLTLRPRAATARPPGYPRHAHEYSEWSEERARRKSLFESGRHRGRAAGGDLLAWGIGVGRTFARGGAVTQNRERL